MEVVVVLGVISIALVGISAMVVQSSQAESLNEKQLVASMLAQEGIELVRNARDDNWLTNEEPPLLWYDGIFDSAVGGDNTYIIFFDDTKGYVIDPTPNDINAAETKLYLSDDGFYRHDDAGEPTFFSRLITTEGILDGEGDVKAIKVESKVVWPERVSKGEYIIETYLYDWR